MLERVRRKKEKQGGWMKIKKGMKERKGEGIWIREGVRVVEGSGGEGISLNKAKII